MSVTKEKVIAIINTLPDDVTIDDILEALIFQNNVEQGLQELQEGKFIPHEEMEGEITQLLKRLPQ